MKNNICFYFLLLLLTAICLGDSVVKINVGIDTWCLFTIKNGDIIFLGDKKGVSSHQDLKRWSAYYFPTPTSRISAGNKKSIIWDMKTPFKLKQIISGNCQTLTIKSVKLLTSGRCEVSMHPNIDNVGKPPTDNHKKDNFIVWNKHELKICDDGNGASPYSIALVLSPDKNKANKSASPQASWLNTKHKLIPPSVNANAIPLDALVFNSKINIGQLHRNNISNLHIQNEKALFDFQDLQQLYAQSWGKSKNRLTEDKFSLLKRPMLEISTSYSPHGKLHHIDFIFYSLDESIPMKQREFFSYAKKLNQELASSLGELKNHVSHIFTSKDKKKKAKWEIWQWECGDKLVEFHVGYELLGGRDILGRYIFIRLTPADSQEKKRFATKSSLIDNVIKKADGSILINNIPMVNQGQKGYCNDAILTSVLLYMGLDINQYSVNLYLINFTPIEYFLRTMKLPFRHYRVNMETPHHNDIAKKYNQKSRASTHPPVTKQDLYEHFSDIRPKLDFPLFRNICSSDKIFSEFRKNIKKYINAGIPIIWGIHGHVRMIIGYNPQKKEIIYRDSWGKDHVAKHMNLYEAFITTNEFIIISPKY